MQIFIAYEYENVQKEWSLLQGKPCVLNRAK